jgi:hypothetical protein
MNTRIMLFIAVLALPVILTLRWATADVETMQAKEKARIERISNTPDFQAEFHRRAAL